MIFLPFIGAVDAVGLLLAFVVGLTILVLILQWSNANIPLLAGHLTGFISGLNDWLSAHLLQWTLQGVNALSALISYPWQQLSTLLTQYLSTLNTLSTYVQGLQNRILGVVDTTYVQPLQAKNAAQDQAISDTAGTAHAQTVALGRAEAQDVNRIEQRQTGDENATNTYVHQLQAAIAANAATDAAQHAESKHWVDGLSQSTDQAFQFVTSQLQAQASSIVHVEGEAQQWSDTARQKAQDYADAVAGVDSAYALTQAKAYADTAAGAVAATLTTYLTDCGTPLCDGLLDTAKVASILTKLFAAGTLAALIERAITDPHGTAATIEPLILGVATPIRDTFDAVLSR